MGLFLVSCVSAYMCVNTATDTKPVQEFKMKINNLAIQEEIKKGVTSEVFDMKMKYFGPCNN